MVYLKYALLMLIRFIRRVLKKLPIIFSYFFLVFSVVVCLVILIPNCFDRIPALSYFISTYELPITYELQGEIRVLDKSDNIVNKNVEVFVGGYSTSLTETTFDLKFSSSLTNEIFVVIRYEVDGHIRIFSECIAINDKNHVIQKEFIIYA